MGKLLKMEMLVVYFLTIVVFCITSSVTVPKSKKLKILFIGNSYTYTHEMPCIFEKIAKLKGKDVYVDSNTKGGCSLKEHCERDDMYEALRSEKWDLVVIQGYSREFIVSDKKIDIDSKPYIDKIIKAAKASNEKVKFAFYMTWAYKNGYHENESSNTSKKMIDRIAHGYEYLSKGYNIPVVPVGLVWQQMEDKNELNLYQRDRAHPSIYGSYAAACTFYASIFNESPEGVRTREIRKKKEAYIQKEVAAYLGY